MVLIRGWEGQTLASVACDEQDLGLSFGYESPAGHAGHRVCDRGLFHIVRERNRCNGVDTETEYTYDDPCARATY